MNEVRKEWVNGASGLKLLMLLYQVSWLGASGDNEGVNAETRRQVAESDKRWISGDFRECCGTETEMRGKNVSRARDHLYKSCAAWPTSSESESRVRSITILPAWPVEPDSQCSHKSPACPGCGEVQKSYQVITSYRRFNKVVNKPRFNDSLRVKTKVSGLRSRYGLGMKLGFRCQGGSLVSAD